MTEHLKKRENRTEEIRVNVIMHVKVEILAEQMYMIQTRIFIITHSLNDYGLASCNGIF